MRVNEEEIPDVSDVSSLTLKQKKINKKRTLKAILEDVSFCSQYELVHVNERSARFNLSEHVNDSKPIEIYDQFISRVHRRLLVFRTNSRADEKFRKKKSVEEKTKF